jgi:hypothetical protein
MKVWIVMALFAGWVGVVGAREAMAFSSGPGQVTLIELFTSEGCSSCPPAEGWLTAKRDDPGLWRTFVPVSWHVDYWNRLGWPDRFSTRSFTERQYAYSRHWQTDSVYTPCFVRDGREWRATDGVVPLTERPGVLTVHYDGATVSGEFAPADAVSRLRYEIHVVLLGGGIQSRVTAGENRGTTLEHEFVALAMVDGELGRALPLPLRRIPGVQREAIAAWVTRRGELAPVQAVGGWLALP